jgi:hypothetical protein
MLILVNYELFRRTICLCREGGGEKVKETETTMRLNFKYLHKMIQHSISSWALTNPRDMRRWSPCESSISTCHRVGLAGLDARTHTRMHTHTQNTHTKNTHTHTHTHTAVWFLLLFEGVVHVVRILVYAWWVCACEHYTFFFKKKCSPCTLRTHVLCREERRLDFAEDSSFRCDALPRLWRVQILTWQGRSFLFHHRQLADVQFLSQYCRPL